ncbi:MAG: hypothetical protein V1827_06440 [Candidatus Micrarchaeota archaeon]
MSSDKIITLDLKAQKPRREYKRALGEKSLQEDLFTLQKIFCGGFSAASGYGDLKRGRYYVRLDADSSELALAEFCLQHLNGKPIPTGRDPTSDGRVLLEMFKAAEEKGIVKVEYHPAGDHLPEQK